MQEIRIIILSVFLIASQLLISQSIEITGIIKNKVNGKPIANAIISFNNSKISSVSDKRGEFEILVVDISTAELIVTHIGFVTSTIYLKNYNTSHPIEIKLAESTLNLSEVEILDSKISNTPTIVTKIGLKQLDETNLTDIGAVLSKQPNIGGIRKGATGIDPVVRGFKYSQVSVLLNDGTRIEGGCPNRMDPTASHVNINDLSDISIYKGPFALKYGPSFGGLIMLETHKPVFYNEYDNSISMILGGQTNHVGQRTGLRLNGGNSIISYVLSTNWNKYGNYTAGNGDIINAASNNYNVNAGIGYKPIIGHTITLNFERSWGRNVDFPTLPMDERKDDTEVYKFSYLVSKFKNSINYLKLMAYHSNVNHEMDNKSRPFSDTVVAISKIHATNTGGRLALNMDAFNGNFEVGSSFEQINKDGNRYKHLILQPGLPVLTENLWNKAVINNLGVYAEFHQSIKKINWIIAFRGDLNSAKSDPMIRLKKNGSIVYENTDTDSEYFNFSISAGITWQINPKSRINLSVGKGTRSPDMTERFITLLPVGYDPYDYLGNPKLLPENNHELDFGYTHDCSWSGYFNASVFFSYVTDYISAVILPPSQVMPQTKGVLGVKNFINIDKVYLTGFEVIYNTPDKNLWQVKLSTAYTAGINPTAIKYIYESGDVVDEEKIKNDPLPEISPLEGNIWFNYSFLKKQLFTEINLRLVAKQNKISEAYNENASPGFNTLNFKAVYSYSKQLNVVMGVKNIFDVAYYEHLNRRIVGSKTPFYEPGRIFYATLIINL